MLVSFLHRLDVGGVLAARRTRRKTTRRRTTKPMLNVLNTAQTLVVASAATKAFFGTDLLSFLLDGWARPVTGNTSPGSYAGGTNNSWELSAAELVRGIIPGGQGFGQSGQGQWTDNTMGVGRAIARNLRQNPQAIMTMVLAPVAFKVGKKVLAKPLINPLNRGIKMLGAQSIVKV